jgi:phage terminase large subunit-like protein
MRRTERFFGWFAAPKDAEIDDPEVWRACNPASWIAMRDLNSQLRSPGFDELDFRRLHLNQWTKTRDAWLEPGLWDSLREEDATIPDGAEVYLGVDVGLIHDSTAVVVAHKRADGRIVVKAHVWTAREDDPGEFVPGGRVQLEAVEQHIAALAKRYRVREVAYDARFFERSAQTLSDAGLLMVQLFQSSCLMADAYQTFYMSCREGIVAHDGDPVLAAHIENTVADRTERGWRVRKLRSSARIDACVAAATAVWRAAVARERPRPSVILL